MIVISRMWTWMQWQESIEPAQLDVYWGIAAMLSSERADGELPVRKTSPLEPFAGSPLLQDQRSNAYRRGRARARRTDVRLKSFALQNGVPLFLSQLIGRLRLDTENTSAIEESAALHGGEQLAMGFNVSQVVHGYGDVCQVITELADEADAPISNRKPQRRETSLRFASRSVPDPDSIQIPMVAEARGSRADVRK